MIRLSVTDETAAPTVSATLRKQMVPGSAEDSVKVDPSNNPSSLVGTWVKGGDSSGQSDFIMLDLRAQGAYTKALKARMFGRDYGGIHSGTWRTRGMIVFLSGDGNWIPFSHDLNTFAKIS